jgi:MFS family permease
MKLPAAIAPLRHNLFRLLWTTNLVVSVGVWLQNTGAGWLMTTLAPDALTVSLVQMATILPIFLLALPAGALADIVDRRLFIMITQGWMLAAAGGLAIMTYAGLTDATSLLAFTFAIGLGQAMNNPAWGSVLAESVPRHDLVQAITLNGIGFNLARAVGPALAGVLVLLGGPALAFGLNALSYFAVIVALLSWHRRPRGTSLPREHLIPAMRAGVRFVRHTPVMQAAMIRTGCFFFAAAAPWAVLPLIVKQQLHMEAGTYGLLLGLMGAGGVTAGLLLPQIRHRFSRGTIVFGSGLISCLGMALVGITQHWLLAAVGMVLFGIGWVAASSVAQGTAQMAAPPWVRSRALAIYQLGFNFALIVGTLFWGWLSTQIGLSQAMLAAAATGVVLSVLARRANIDLEPNMIAAVPRDAPPVPEAVDPELIELVSEGRNRVMEWQRYRINSGNSEQFIAAMAEVRDVRGRAGAVGWQLYEDIAHADGWVEVWTVENWTDHLREATRLSGADRAVLAQAMALHIDTPIPPSRFIAVAPHRLPNGTRAN